MGILKIALLQIAPCGTLQGNLKKGMEACEKAKALGADIALFPEMWSNGYRIYGRPVQEWTAEAIPADGPFIQAFQRLAETLGMAIGVTLLERHEGGPRNSLVLFDRFGRRRIRIFVGIEFYVPPVARLLARPVRHEFSAQL